MPRDSARRRHDRRSGRSTGDPTPRGRSPARAGGEAGPTSGSYASPNFQWGEAARDRLACSRWLGREGCCRRLDTARARSAAGTKADRQLRENRGGSSTKKRRSFHQSLTRPDHPRLWSMRPRDSVAAASRRGGPIPRITWTGPHPIGTGLTKREAGLAGSRRAAGWVPLTDPGHLGCLAGTQRPAPMPTHPSTIRDDPDPPLDDPGHPHQHMPLRSSRTGQALGYGNPDIPRATNTAARGGLTGLGRSSRLNRVDEPGGVSAASAGAAIEREAAR